MENLREASDAMKEKKRVQEVPLRGYDLSVLQRELLQQMQPLDEQQQQQQQQQVVELLVEQKFCPHDFSVLCPFAWNPSSDGSSCTAPEAYIGEDEGLGFRV